LRMIKRDILRDVDVWHDSRSRYTVAEGDK
jgi:hypothetical protein